MHLLLLLLLALARADSPEESFPAIPAAPPVETAEEPLLSPFDREVGRAKRLYFEGEHERALEVFQGLLERLDDGEEVPEGLFTEALLYMGEVQYQLGDRAAAWRTFERLLQNDPEQVMSPYHHPREVVHWFELVKQRVNQANSEPPPPLKPLPAWGYAPFGVPQLAQGRTARGVVFASLQVGLGTASIASFFYLNAVNNQDHPSGWSDDDVVGRVNRVRYAIQWPTSIGFYVLWLASHLDARRTWFRDQRAEITVGLALDRRLTTLAISARF
jgi:tetratricopeptide (TPR) repeat protein